MITSPTTFEKYENNNNNWMVPPLMKNIESKSKFIWEINTTNIYIFNDPRDILTIQTYLYVNI